MGRLDKNALDHLRTGVLKGLGTLVPLAKVLDSSPYDRAMKRFHDYMKDSAEFQDDPEGHVEMRFAPYSAWMVFADGVSHGCLSGQHCFIWTALTPLANMQFPEIAPINVLRGRPEVISARIPAPAAGWRGRPMPDRTSGHPWPPVARPGCAARPAALASRTRRHTASLRQPGNPNRCIPKKQHSGNRGEHRRGTDVAQAVQVAEGQVRSKQGLQSRSR